MVWEAGQKQLSKPLAGGVVPNPGSGVKEVKDGPFFLYLDFFV